MAEVTVYTADRMQEIEDSAIVAGAVNGSGHLILTTHDSTDIDAGLVQGVDGVDGVDGDPGPPASIGTTPPSSPVSGQIWYDTSILSGLTDLMAATNPTTATTNWVALGYGYDTGITFSIAGGGCTHTYSTTGNHLGGIALAGLTPGNSYLIIAKLFVPTSSPDVNIGVGFKTSSHSMKVKDQDVTVMQNFIADETGAYFGVESGGATGSVVVKAFQVYEVNAKGLPCYIYNGAEWQETVSMGAKGDVYSRVNTFGNQTVNGEKTWTGKAKFAPATDVVPLTIVRGTDTAPAARLLEVQNHAGTALTYLDYNGGLSAPSVASSYGLFTALDAGTIRATAAYDISSTNLDSLAYSGMFRGSSLTNSPDGTSAAFYVECIIIDSNNKLQRAAQAGASPPKRYIREKISGTWQPWTRTDAELLGQTTLSVTAQTGWSVQTAIGAKYGRMGVIRINYTRTGSAISVPADGNIANQDVVQLPSGWEAIFAQGIGTYSSGRMCVHNVTQTGMVQMVATTNGSTGATTIPTSDAFSLSGSYILLDY